MNTVNSCYIHYYSDGILFCVMGQVILHYIPLTEIARRLLCRRQFRGKLYHGFEIQRSERKPGARAFGRSNSTFWFETAQARADYMLQAAGYAGPCRIAGLEVVSDGSYGGKHQGWHGVYGEPSMTCTFHVLHMYFHVRCVPGEAEQSCTDFKIHIIIYNSTLQIHEKNIRIHDGTRQYMPSQAGAPCPCPGKCVFCMI